MNISLVLLVFAFVFACIASFVPGPIYGRWHFGWLALAFFLAAQLAGGIGRLGLHALLVVALAYALLMPAPARAAELAPLTVQEQTSLAAELKRVPPAATKGDLELVIGAAED